MMMMIMKRVALTGLVWAAVATAAFAQNTLTTVDFQDSEPFNQLTHTATTPALTERSNEGACGGTTFWTSTRVAPATGNGGKNNRGYTKMTWCSYDTTTAGFGSGQSGWYSGSAEYTPTSGWQSTDTVFIRYRVYYESGILRHTTASQVVEGNTVTSETHHHFKHALFQKGSGGDNRAIIFESPGNFDPSGGGAGYGGSCNGSATTQVCISIQRNVDHYTCAAYALVPVGRWVDLQFAFKTGTTGVGFVKVWVDNNTSGSPTAQDTSCDPWTFNATDMDAGFDFGNAANNGTATTNDFVKRLMDFQVGLAFDSSWYSADTAGGGSSGGNPGSTPIRGVLSIAAADLKDWMGNTE